MEEVTQWKFVEISHTLKLLKRIAYFLCMILIIIFDKIIKYVILLICNYLILYMWISFVGLLDIFNWYVIHCSYIHEYYLYDWIYEIRKFTTSKEVGSNIRLIMILY